MAGLDLFLAPPQTSHLLSNPTWSLLSIFTATILIHQVSSLLLLQPPTGFPSTSALVPSLSTSSFLECVCQIRSRAPPGALESMLMPRRHLGSPYFSDLRLNVTTFSKHVLPIILSHCSFFIASVLAFQLIVCLPP